MILLVVRQPVRGLGRKRNEAGAGGRREHRAESAVDVAARERVDRLVAGDGMERRAAEIVGDAQAPADRVELLVVLAVDGNLVLAEAGHEVVRAGHEDVGAEHAGSAVEAARMDVDEHFERVGLEEELRAAGNLVEALERVALAGEPVVHPVVAMLVDAGHAHRPLIGQRAADGALGVERAVRAVRGLCIAAALARGADRVELHDARRRVAAEQRALRTAKHLDHLEIEHREALQDRAFLHDVVVHERDGLRGVQVEVGVAEAADVEARESSPERRLDAEARQPR